MMITGIPAFGLELASSVTVYAEDEIDNTGSGTDKMDGQILESVFFLPIFRLFA